MFSQNDEESYIVKFFGDKAGNFLDIGAYDGKAFSNTHRLALNGWGGVCFEPSVSVFPQLETLYKDRDDVVCDKRAIGSKRGKAIFYDSSGDAISSFDTAHVKKWEKNWNSKFKQVEVDVIPFSDILDEYGSDFDFINIDVESTNYEIFKLLDFKKLNKCKLFCIEHDRRDREIERTLKQFGFRQILRNPENIILGRK